MAPILAKRRNRLLWFSPRSSPAFVSSRSLCQAILSSSRSGGHREVQLRRFSLGCRKTVAQHCQWQLRRPERCGNARCELLAEQLVVIASCLATAQGAGCIQVSPSPMAMKLNEAAGVGTDTHPVTPRILSVKRHVIGRLVRC